MVSPTKRSARVGVAPAYAMSDRVTRRPAHRFNLKTKPWQIQPFVVAPVLPGETLQTIMLQAQSWSDPLATGILRNVGWWCEYFFFYVKHRDLPNWERDETVNAGLGSDLIDMIVNNGSLAAYKEAANVTWTYTPKGGVDFVKAAVYRIVEEYFRDEGESATFVSVDGVPLAQIYGRGQDDWSARVTATASYQDRRTKLDVDNSGVIHMDEINRAYAEWAAGYDAGLIAMDYEDWMRTYGSTSVLPNNDRVDYHRPELLAYHREFSYPTNTVEPTTGIPATAVGWRTAKQFRKNWLFPEPGWIIGLTVKRPKVYLERQEGNVASMMQTRNSWLPAVLNDQLDVSHLFVAQGDGPLSAVSTASASGYYVDLRDLLNNGDQFINYAITNIAPFVSLPFASIGGVKRYPGGEDVMSFFLNTTTGRFLEDGVANFVIKGRQQPRGDNLVLGRA